MVVEISQEQKALLSQKIKLCVDFIKNEVQPHMVEGDTISVKVGALLELFITRSDMYVKETYSISLLFWEPSSTRVFYLEKFEKSKKKKFICEHSPESAVEFLKNWEKAKEFLQSEVSNKISKEENLNNFINDFKL